MSVWCNGREMSCLNFYWGCRPLKLFFAAPENPSCSSVCGPWKRSNDKKKREPRIWLIKVFVISVKVSMLQFYYCPTKLCRWKCQVLQVSQLLRTIAATKTKKNMEGKKIKRATNSRIKMVPIFFFNKNYK
jgi:hypothetical protein